MGLIISLLLHAGIAVSLLASSLFSKKIPLIPETPECTIPLDIVAISEVSQAPISKPKVARPMEQRRKPVVIEEKSESEDILEDILKEGEEKPTTPSEEKPVEKPIATPAEKQAESKPIEPPLKAPEPKQAESPPEKKPTKKDQPTDEAAIDELLKDLVTGKTPSEKPVEKPIEKPVKKPVEKPVEKPKPTPKPAEKPKPAAKAKAKDKASKVLKTPKKPSDQKKVAEGQEDFIKILRDLDKRQQLGPSAQTPQTDPHSQSAWGAEQVGPKLSMSVIDRVRRLLEEVWRVPPLAHEGGTLIVVVRMEMNPDGTVHDAQIINSESTVNHPAYQIAAESALQAVFHFRPGCPKPLPLPRDQYEQWKIFTFRFIRQ